MKYDKSIEGIMDIIWALKEWNVFLHVLHMLFFFNSSCRVGRIKRKKLTKNNQNQEKNKPSTPPQKNLKTKVK